MSSSIEVNKLSVLYVNNTGYLRQINALNRIIGIKQVENSRLNSYEYLVENKNVNIIDVNFETMLVIFPHFSGEDINNYLSKLVL